MGNNKTKNIILAVLVVGIVSMTIAFAALTQQLNITDNVATVSSNWRVRFAPTVTTSVGTTIAGTTTGATYTSNTPTVTNDQQTITGLQATFTKPGDYVEVAFTVRNEGNIAAKGQGVTLSLGNLTCAPGSGSSVSQEAANTFCTKLVKWVKHSDRVTDWTSADTLAAYSGSGNDYPHIDGILRIEYPSTLSNSDIAAINGGSVVVTLGDTTLHFEQDDNVTASNNSGSGSGNSGNEQSGGGNEEPAAQTWDNYITPTQSSGGTTLPNNSIVWLQQNTSTNAMEVCETFPNDTVCLTRDPNGRESDFQDCENYEEYTGSGTTCIKGYAKAKADEMLAKGGTKCIIFGEDWEMNCYSSDTVYCHMSYTGNVDCYYNNGYNGCMLFDSKGNYTCEW